MTIRELLKIELWSKETSRRVFRSSIRVFVALAILFGPYYAIERFWLTPWEHKAAREALKRIDALQHFEAIDERDFQKGKNDAEQSVEIAKKAALTWRDKGIGLGLEMYLGLLEIDQESWVRDRQLIREHPEWFKRLPDARDVQTTSKQATLLVGLRLHQSLD